MAAAWDYLTSKVGKHRLTFKKLTFKKAWEKQTGRQEETEISLPSAAQQPSSKWKDTHTVYRIGRYIDKNLAGTLINKRRAQAEISELKTIQRELRKNPGFLDTPINNEKNRFFSNAKTSKFITEELPLRASPRSCG